ncbi:MAG: NAD(+) synthase [Erysipelotrichaceae bacterium]|nr:NAD(+) synthase [Erysipelotrichaceae bacterium]MBR6234122.1 NAD(+) synthase [Erysipelotrichaceae bacterium]
MTDAVKETEKIVGFVRDYFEKNHLKGAVLGISGGKDSGVVAAIMCKALGPENVVGITLPCHSKDADAADAKLVAEKFGFELLNIDLTTVFDAFKTEIGKLGDFTQEELKNSDINLKPRLRMSSVYYMAALLSATRGGTYVVPGTSNACELYVGYFTKGGDSVYDIAPIYSLTVDEVIRVGEVLGVPEKVLYRTPDDGISGLSDEDKMGVKYADIGKIIRGKDVDPIEREKIEELHRKAAHKFNIPVYKIED